jgi:hypothetical protein
MSVQIFKNQIPSQMLFELLDVICVKNDKCFIFDNIAYKKGMFNNSINEFIEKCKPYYRLSKLKYLEKKNYNSFTTIIRQICNYKKINYTSQIKYNKSRHEIIYYIYF